MSDKMRRRAEIAKKIRDAMREPAPRPSGGDSRLTIRQHQIYHDLILVPAIAAGHFAFSIRPQILSNIAVDWMKIRQIKPAGNVTSRANKDHIDTFYRDMDDMMEALMKHIDPREEA